MDKNSMVSSTMVTSTWKDTSSISCSTWNDNTIWKNNNNEFRITTQKCQPNWFQHQFNMFDNGFNTSMFVLWLNILNLSIIVQIPKLFPCKFVLTVARKSIIPIPHKVQTLCYLRRLFLLQNVIVLWH